MEYALPILDHQLVDKLLLFCCQLMAINIAPIALIQGERLITLDEILIFAIPGDQSELGIVCQANLHCEHPKKMEAKKTRLKPRFNPSIYSSSSRAWR